MKSIISILIFFLVSFFSYPKKIIVCATCAVQTVNNAVKIAQNGDEILIKKGIYRENQIIIDKAVNISGENYPILDGEMKNEIFTVIADDVTIEGLQIQNVGISYLKEIAAIRIKKAKNFKIKANRIFNAFFGIYLEHANYGEVINNQIIGNAEEEISSGNGIHAWYCKNLIIENNLIKRHRDGIYFEFVNNSFITSNQSKENLRYGLHFMFSNDDNYKKNIFYKNGAGVAVMFSRRINMYQNHFLENWGSSSYGLLLKEIYDAEIVNNVFKKNTIGIYVEGSTRIKYHHNEFIQNGWAIKMAGGSLNNKIYKNNFIANTFELVVFSSANNNTFDGNYWSEYAGYDLDKDKIGDVAYRPVKLFSFIVNKTPEAMILLRSTFVDLINLSEKVSPIFTPKNVLDHFPMMVKIDTRTDEQ